MALTEPAASLSLIRDFNSSTKDIGEGDLQSEEVRQKILELSQKVTTALRKPEDVVIQQAFTPYLNMCVRVCIDLDLFKTLAAKDGPATADELAQATGADPLLIVRFMRAVAGLGFAENIDVETYAPNAITRALASPSLSAGFSHSFDNQSYPQSLLSESIEYYKEHDYKCPTSATDGPYQHAYNTNLTSFEHWTTDPAKLKRFNTFMTGQRGGRRNWVDWFPVQQHLLADASTDPDAVMLVDIGGGHGHDTQAFLHAHPRAPGRFVLQDLGPVIDEIEPSFLDPRIERQTHDFFTEQPVHGARAYFVHMVLHDWPNEDCVRIIQEVAKAMHPGYSKLLINEVVLPDKDTPLIQAGFDITMMSHHAGMERSERQWCELVSKAGLEVAKIWESPGGEGIVECVRR